MFLCISVSRLFTLYSRVWCHCLKSSSVRRVTPKILAVSTSFVGVEWSRRCTKSCVRQRNSVRLGLQSSEKPVTAVSMMVRTRVTVDDGTGRYQIVRYHCMYNGALLHGRFQTITALKMYNIVLKYVSSTALIEAGFSRVDNDSIAMSTVTYIVVVTYIQFANMQNNSKVTGRYNGNDDVCAADDKLPFEGDGSSKMLQAKSALLHQLTGN